MRFVQRCVLTLLLSLGLGWLIGPTAQAADTPPPASVVIVGTIQSVLGCSADWQPDCADSQLTFDPTHQLWLATFDLPAGNYEYKAALNGSLAENYGLNATLDGPNIPLTLGKETSVTFFYAHNTHWVADNVGYFLANVPGNFNSEVGCPATAFDDPGNPGDWAPDCLQTLLQDPDGDGIYTFATTKLPAGNYEGKVALNQSWSVNYGDGGASGGANIPFTVAKDNAEVVFMWDSKTKALTISAAGAPKGNLGELSAYWAALPTILTSFGAGNTFTLYYSADASLAIDDTGITGGEAFSLTPGAGIDSRITDKYPHLAGLTPLQLPQDAVGRAGELLRGQLALGVADPAGNPVSAVGLQLAGVLDELYTTDEPLGVVFEGDEPTLRLWAPTAQSVHLHLFADSSAESDILLPMQRDDASGVWSITGAPNWQGQFYLYEVQVYAPTKGEIVANLVTDPYSLSLSTNSLRSQIVDLRVAALKPAGWDALSKPLLAAPEDIILYELHVRDFSIYDESVPEAERGTFMAFTHPDSAGMTHLRRLAAAGLTHVHLLPAFDFATINEDRATQRNPLPRYLAQFPPDSDQQQQAVNNLRDQDGFNWGYDPLHYTTPEGNYAVNPDGSARITEFRAMVQAFNTTGLRVVMDVVYNHTSASGQADKSILDRIVPGYYHRLDSRGRVANSTCCANTATENNMMRKLMVDSVVTWARAYKIDGFRFDLMGHHMVDDMLAVRAALDALTLEADGVDGKSIYIYGEGWNFGEVADNARGVNATQLNLAGTGIGTFNDRLRDAARGGNPFGGFQEQGFINGLHSDPNATTQGAPESQKTRLLQFMDQIRVGLAGNLADYQFEAASGALTRGSGVDYNGSPAGYTADPQENIVYVSAHDNETLFDAIQYKAPLATTMADRVRMQNLGLDLVLLAQGVPFIHAGDEMLRSKSMDRDSYNSGDWFNHLDYSYATNNWGIGLPISDKNKDNWPIIGPLLANPNLKPAPADLQSAVSHVTEMLQVRRSSPLFRLQSADQVMARLRFLNTGPDQIPGLIVMALDDTPGESLDPNFDRLVVFFNGTNAAQSFTAAELADVAWVLHPVQAASADPLVRSAAFAAGAFNIPARTTAVFVLPAASSTAVAGEVSTPAGPAAPTEPAPPPAATETAGASPWVAVGAGAAVVAAAGGAYLFLRRR